MARRGGHLSFGLLATVTGFAAALACSKFGSSEPSNESPEAGLEASLADGPSTSDGGDGGTLPDARACPIVLDEHFDSPTFAGWTNDTTGMLTPDPMVFRAGAPSLHAVANVTAGASTHARLTRTYNIKPSGVGTATLSFSMLVEPTMGADVYREVGCGMKFKNGSTETLVAIGLYANAALVTLVSNPDGGVSQDRTYLFEPALPGWYDVKFTLSALAPTQAIVDIAVTDEGGTTKDSSKQVVLPLGLDTLQLACGINYSNLDVDSGTATVSVHVDDLLLTRCPPP